MQLHKNGSSKFTSSRSFSISSKISSLGDRIVTEVDDGIMLNSHNRTQHNLSGHFLRIRQWGGGGSTKRGHTIPSVEKL